MPTLYVTRPQETLESISRHYNITESLIPQFARHNCCSINNGLPMHELLILPDSENELCTSEYKSLIDLKNQLTHQERNTLAQTIVNHGSNTFSTVTDWWAAQAPYDDEAKAVFGGLLSAAHMKNQGMEKAINQYNEALLKYRNATPAQRPMIKRQVINSFKHLNNQFQQDLKQLDSKHRKLNRNPLHSAQRGMNIAKDSRNSINLNSMAEVQHLKRVIKNTNFSTRGLMVLDLGLAGYKVHNANKTGGNTTKTALEELGAILVGGITAHFATAMGVALLPGVGIIVLTTLAAGSAILGSQWGKDIGNHLYNYLQNLEKEQRLTSYMSNSALSIL